MGATPIGDEAPVIALLPGSVRDPILVFEAAAALRMAIVERDGVSSLDAGWDIPGVYVLFDPPDVDGAYGCYVGQAPSGIRSRLSSHLRSKDHWRRALLIAKDTTHGFHSAHCGWLEGRLYDLFSAAEFARLHNGVRPKDETLPPYELAALEACITPIARTVRLLGYNPETPDDSPVPTRRRTNRFYGISLEEIVNAGLIPVGARLVSTNSVYAATATVGEHGTVIYDRDSYATPSAAACAVKDGKAANGWDFWAVDQDGRTTPLATFRTQYLDAKNKGGEQTGV